MVQFPIFRKPLHFSSLLQLFISPDPDPEFCMSTVRRENIRLNSLSHVALATNLYVSSYSGSITTLNLNQDPHALNGYSLTEITSNNGSAPSPSWLEIGPDKDLVFCVDEGLPVPNGSISSYKNTASGDLTLLDRHTTLGGPVSTIIYNGGKALVAAHYGGSAITTWRITSTGSIDPLQNITFTMSAPGPNAGRQEAPHPHEAIVDPTDSYIIVPDLGADLLRIFSIDSSTSLLREDTPFSVTLGSGPRHGTFLKVDATNTTYFFVVTELGNTVTSYKVTYGAPSMNFTEVFRSSIYGPIEAPEGAAAAECILSPDKKYLLTSSRNDSLFQIPNFSSTNNTALPSDTLQSWKIDSATGNLTFVQVAAAGGMYPRQFSTNANGTLVGVGLQNDGRVVVMKRDPETGLFGSIVANFEGLAQVTSVVFDE